MTDRHISYARDIEKTLRAAHVFVEMDCRDRTIPKRIRDAQIAQSNVIIVVGDREESGGTVAVRFRDATQKARGNAIRCASEKNETLSEEVLFKLRSKAQETASKEKTETMSIDELVHMCCELKRLKL